MITYKLKINCQDPRMLVSDMEFVAGDVNAYRLEFTFYDNGERINLSDKILTVKGKRADGVILSGSGQIDGTQAAFVPANAFYAVPGELVLEIALTDSAGNYMTTKMISVTVLEGLGEPTEMATTNVSAYVTLLAQLTNRLSSADQLIAETKSFYESELQGVSDFMKNKPAIENGEGVGSLVGVVSDSQIEDETDFTNTATADNAVTFGKSNTNSGKRSIVVGKGNVNTGANNIVAGQYNAGKVSTLLELGNGASASDRSNAFEVYTDGSISLDNGETKLTPAGVKHLVTLKDEVDDLAQHTEELQSQIDVIDEKAEGLQSQIDVIGENAEELQSNTEQAISDVKNQCANALKAKASGEVISLDDVSPLAHALKVWAHSKNLFRFTSTYAGEKNGVAIGVEEGKAAISLNCTEATATSIDNCCRITLPAGKYTVSITNAYGTDYLYVRNRKENTYYNNVTSTKPLTFEVTEETELDMGFVIRQGSSYDHATIFIQLEEGTVKTEFVPYVDEIGNHIFVNGEECIIHADGTVDGVESTAPNMTLSTDTEGVVLSVEYNRDTNKVIESLISAIISLGGNV